MEREADADCGYEYDEVASYSEDRGEEYCLEDLHRDEFGFVWRTLHHLGVPPAALEDAVQDVFLVVHRRLDEFEGRSSPRTWLFGIARRVASRHRRTNQRRQRKLDALADVELDSPDLEREVARGQAVGILADFLDSLDDDKREVFVLHTLEGVTGREIAEALGVSVNTGHSRLRLARERFERLCGRLRVEEQRALAQGRADEPAAGAQRQAWALLVPFLELPKSAGVSGAIAWTVLDKAKIFVATIALGATGVGAIKVATQPAPLPISAPTSAVATAQEERATAPAPRPTPTPAVIEEAGETAAPPLREARPSSAPLPKADSTLSREIRLMTRLRGLVQSDATAALDLIDRGDRQFPRGEFAIERAGYRAMALCGSGRAREGRGAANLFLDRHPAAGIADQVRSTCLD
jgi:RNA polymerase sigma-70 factor (ECF subfamily)